MVYTPAFETQRDDAAPTPWTNCNPASVAMLIDWYTYGRVNISDVDIRRASSVPLSSGMNFAEVDAAIRKLGLSVGGLLYSDLPSGNANITWEDLLRHLRGGGGAAVAGNYTGIGFRNSKGWGDHRAIGSNLLIRRWQPTGTFGHMVYVGQATQDDVLLMDPLAHGDYRGDRITIAALWDFIWKTGWQDASVRVVAGHWFTAARPAEIVPGPSLADRLLAKDAACDAAGVKVAELERSVIADLTEVRREFDIRVAALRLQLRELRSK